MCTVTCRGCGQLVESGTDGCPNCTVVDDVESSTPVESQQVFTEPDGGPCDDCIEENCDECDLGM